MAFKAANLARLAKFNSAASSDFIDMYESIVDKSIIARNAEPKHQTFAPSAFRCPRVSWFRLRGVQPDSISTPDRTMEFSAQIGTACHRIIQQNLKDELGQDWLDVEEYVNSCSDLRERYDWNFEPSEDSLETLITISNPPVRFACDGIIRWNNSIYLLEIKTSEFASFDDLMDAKPQHVDQIKCYATLFDLDHVLVLYQDRQYGGLKCYEKTVTLQDKQAVNNRFQYVMDMVECNLAPDRLPKGDAWCNSNHCPYYKKCKEWG